MRLRPLPCLLLGAVVPCLFLTFALYASRDSPLFMSLQPSTRPVLEMFRQRLVHLDLKGAPPKLSYLRELFPFFRDLGFTGLLVEYEDMFPYGGELAVVRARHHYTHSDIVDIQLAAEAANLEVIPLIQTFGHLEFVLKHEKYSHLREVPDKTDTICPSEPQSLVVIRELLSQIRAAHPLAKAIHIGADEAWHIAEDERCQLKVNQTFDGSVEALKLAHISTVAQYAKETLGFQRVFAWNDLFATTNVSSLRAAKLGDFVIPVVWGYAEDVNLPGYFADGMMGRYAEVFNDIYFASAFKGANGVSQTFISTERYLNNLRSYVGYYHANSVELKNRIRGTVLTGWSRYWHGAELCELMPAGIPALVIQGIYMQEGPYISSLDLEAKALRLLNCTSLTRPPNIEFNGFVYRPRPEAIFATCSFPDSSVFSLIEHLHLLKWKLMLAADTSTPDIREQLRREKTQLRAALESHLAVYFFPDAVEEFLRQNFI